MRSLLLYPALVLATLGVGSGLLGTCALGLGYGEAPQPGLYMVLTGLWFGLVVGFGVWQWGNRSWVAAATALAATWCAWELAVNLAMQLDENWLQKIGIADGLRAYVSGFASGAVGAFLTWAGAAWFTPALQNRTATVGVVSVGAFFGLLLPWTNHYDNPAILLLPWQAAVAATLGSWISAPRRP
jgi:hypothetical protein